MFAFAARNLSAGLGVALTLMQLLHMTVNPITDLKLPGLGAKLGLLIWSFVQLAAEQVLTVLRFPAILTLDFGRLGLGRNAAITLAWLRSALVFAMAHLPTCNWTVLQCLAVVGTVRLGGDPGRCEDEDPLDLCRGA